MYVRRRANRLGWLYEIGSRLFRSHDLTLAYATTSSGRLTQVTFRFLEARCSWVSQSIADA